MWDHLWMAWWQHKKWNHAQQSTKNDWDSLSVWRQLTMMSKIGQWLKCQKWKIAKENKVEKCSFCTTFCLHFIFSTNCSEQNVLFSLKHKLKTWTVLFFAHFFLMNQKWNQTKNVMRRKWPSMCVVVKGHRLEEKCQEKCHCNKKLNQND